MADIIDAELADMRGRSIEEYIEAARQDAYDMGDTDPSPPPARLIDMRGRIAPDHPAHQAVDLPWPQRGRWPLPRSRHPGRCASARHHPARPAWCARTGMGGP